MQPVLTNDDHALYNQATRSIAASIWVLALVHVGAASLDIVDLNFRAVELHTAQALRTLKRAERWGRRHLKQLGFTRAELEWATARG